MRIVPLQDECSPREPYGWRLGEAHWHRTPWLETSLTKAGTQLDDETFRTFMTEAECIINSRPLTTENLGNPDAPEPLTPNHLLTMKPKITLPPPGKFQRPDLYCRKWWRRVQYLANEFWLRWRREYLQALQLRQKWVHPKKDLKIGDIVISWPGWCKFIRVKMDASERLRFWWRMKRLTARAKGSRPRRCQCTSWSSSCLRTIPTRWSHKRPRKSPPKSQTPRRNSAAYVLGLQIFIVILFVGTLFL